MKMKESTNNQQIILASSSLTRAQIIRQYFSNVIIKDHKINEQTIKTKSQNLPPEKLVIYLAKEKARSLLKYYKETIIIGSDQILICKNKRIDKARNLEEAKKKLFFMRGNEHALLSAIYVFKNGKFFFKELKKATLYFRNIIDKEIEKYLEKNNESALRSVGAYRIEENNKHNFVKIISGDIETIKGFPVKNFINKLRETK